MKKRIIITSILISFLLAIIISISLFYNLNHITYKKSDEGYILKKAYGYMNEYTIKDTYKDKEIICINERAFEDYDDLKVISFGNNLEEAGKLAFGDCDNLEIVNFNANFRYPGNNMFYNDKALKEVNFPTDSKLYIISGSMFYNCISLEKFVIPDSTTLIGSLSFYNCTSLKTITIPSSLKELETNSFLGCDNLETIYIKGFSNNYYKWINSLPLDVKIEYIS